MNKDSGYLLITIASVTAVSLLIIMLAGFIYPGGFHILGITPQSTYEYTVSIDMDGAVAEDAQLFIPLPSLSDRSPVGAAILEGKGTGVPDGWDIELFGSKGSTMLKITADELRTTEFGITVDAGDLIDTENPVGSAYTLLPKEDTMATDSGIKYNTYIYAEYSSDSGAEIEIGIELTGKNSWSMFSEKSNSFTDTVSLSLNPPVKGWYPSSGDLVAGIGDYTII
ncbi:hypothetical protein [Methanoplanus endosymbiosus]|uniref:Type IV pilin n=1 Tax=Methanoplanus endosymbiosus TaxID=33865 RepID=A0A9E7PMY4_9EURY|nr:hypothetical protein [Methanoplanus endosymbiosus]UUX91626.1 hypothetical protein L6E24_09610 [Methanoplanus endosymbiosus]